MNSRRKWLRLATAAAGLLVVLVLSAALFPRQLLLVDSGPVTADVLVVLGGGSGERVDTAAELFKAGVAPRIIVSGAGDADDNKRLLVNRGVPAEAIQLESASTSTRQNAQMTIGLLRSEHVHRAIIVTSWYHSRRALHCFRHYGPELEFYSRPSYYGLERGHSWAGEHLAAFIRAEYVKVAGYWVCYGVCPF